MFLSLLQQKIDEEDVKTKHFARSLSTSNNIRTLAYLGLWE